MPIFAEHRLYQQLVEQASPPPTGCATPPPDAHPQVSRPESLRPPAVARLGTAPVTRTDLDAVLRAGTAATMALAPTPITVVVFTAAESASSPLARAAAGRWPDAAAGLLFCADVGRAGERYGQLLVAAGWGAQAAWLAAHAEGLAGRLDHRPGVVPAVRQQGPEPLDHLCTLLIGRPA
ncbi:hypothetical protein AB0D32_06600 [Micromonospora sp. NPDC048170]|uniref:hypothetical protein n=1 Tax=Micromonospora sp. NPDC048170 TaxID=3154819 RepID=UPI0033FBF7E6